MSQGIERQGGGAARAEAIAWLLRLDSAEATEAEWLAFQAWIEAAPEHLDAYERADRVTSGLVASAPDLLPALGPRPVATPAPRRRREARAPSRRAWIWPSVAGLAAAAAALVLFVAPNATQPAPTTLYQTAKGQNRLLNLADGSHIHLNSGSRLSVRLERKARYVDLAEGEAAFDVAKDPARPFLIAAGERDIRVVGTEFDVLRHDGLLRVTVRRGIVAVQSPETGPQAEPVLLKVGDQLEHQAGDRVATVRRVDPDAAFAWRTGELIYQDQPLDQVVGDLNRYFAIPVRVVGPAARLRFSGVLRIDAEDDVIRRLRGFLQISAEQSPDGVTLRMRDTPR